MALYQHKQAGGDPASAPLVAPAAVASAATLGAFKSNLNQITAQLTSTMSGRRAPGGAAPGQSQDAYNQASMLARVSQGPSHARTGSGTSFSEAASAVKERTREGFAKVAFMVKGLQSWGEAGAPNSPSG